MTMFSMKPKFDLAEFLAVPAPVGSARSRNARSRKMQFQSKTRGQGSVPPEAEEDQAQSDRSDE